MIDALQRYIGLDDGVTVFSVEIRTDGGIAFQYAEPGDLMNGCVRTRLLIVPAEAVDLVDLIDTFRQALSDAEVYMRKPRRSFVKGEEE
jgi:hypothetical protein